MFKSSSITYLLILHKNFETHLDREAEKQKIN